MKRSIANLYLILLSLVVIGGLSFYLQSKKSPELSVAPLEIPRSFDTTNWVRYTEKELAIPGISMQCPNSHHQCIAVWPVNDRYSATTSLDEYALSFWKANYYHLYSDVPSHKTSELQTTTVNGRPAYRIDMEGGVDYSSGSGSVLYEKTTFIITANDKNEIYRIEYPTDDLLSQTIFKTLIIDNSVDPRNINLGDYFYEG